MKNLHRFLLTCFLFTVSFGTLATTYNFDGELSVTDTSGVSFTPSTVSGTVNFDLNTGMGNGGTIQEFLPKTGGVTISDLQIASIGNNLFNLDFTVGLSSTSFAGSLVWEILELGNGNLSVLTVDGNGDGIPGLPLSDETPFPGFSMALDGTLSTVPVPAAVWLFGSGLLGLIGIARRKANH